MAQLQQKLIIFTAILLSFASAASRKEDLERAAEIAVEKAAERAAERAVEKALESGNTTTESKIVHDSYSSVRKYHPSQSPYESGEEQDTEIKEKEEVDVPDDPEYSSESGEYEPFAFTSDFLPKAKPYHLPNLKTQFRRYPRSGWNQEAWPRSTDDSGKIVTVEKKVPAPVKIERTILHSVYKHVPYEVKVLVPFPYTVERKVPYPVKVFVDVPVDVPQPDEVKVDRPVPYKVEVPVPQLYTVEKKKVPVEVKVRVPQPHPVDKPIPYHRPYEVKVPVKVTTPYEVEQKATVPIEVAIDKPYPVPAAKPYFLYAPKPAAVSVLKSYPAKVPAERPIPVHVKVPEPQPYTVEKSMPVEVGKRYPLHIKVPVLTAHTKPVPVDVRERERKDVLSRNEAYVKFQRDRFAGI